MQKLKIIGILQFLLICYSCEKKDRNPKFSPLLQETKDWMLFDTGTYWVFEENNSGIEDSVFVTSSEILQLGASGMDPTEPNVIHEFGVVNLSNKRYLFLSGTLGGNSIFKEVRIGSELVSTTLLNPPNTVGSSSPGSSSKVTEFVVNFEFNNIRADLVKRFDTKDPTENNESVEYHIMKGVGIIRKINHTKKEDWQLQRFNIVMNSD